MQPLSCTTGLIQNVLFVLFKDGSIRVTDRDKDSGNTGYWLPLKCQRINHFPEDVQHVSDLKE